MKNAFSSRKFKGGAYTTILSVLVIFLVLMVNLIVSGVTTSKDLTGLQMYSLHDDTVEFLKDYDVPINLYYFTEVGKENKVLVSAAENFANQGKNINLIYKDPVQYPSLVFKYFSTDSIDNNSIVLERQDAPDRFVTIEYEVMCLYYINTTDYSKTLAGYNMEAEVLKGLVKLSDTENDNVYIATGHGEQTMDDDGKVSTLLSDLLELNSYNVKYVDIKKKGIPEDCSALLILGAIDDLSEDECTAIKDYVTAGGRVMWFLTYTFSDRPNTQALLNYYGLNQEKGVLCERDTERTAGGSEENILAVYGNKNAAWPRGAVLTKLNSVRDTLVVKEIASTSEKAYRCEDLKDRTFKEGYSTGKYPLLVEITETYQGSTGKVYLFNSHYFLQSNLFRANSSYANSEVFTACLGELCEKESSISVPATSNYEEALKLTTHQKNVLLIILVGVIPGLILLAGFVVVFLRRK